MQLKYLLVLCLVIVSVYNVSSLTEGSFASIKVNECVLIKQTCANCTYCSITSINNEESTQILGLTSMTKNDTEFIYTFCNNLNSGVYTVNGKCDPDGVTDIFQKVYDVSYSGYTDTLGFYFIILLIGFGIMVLGFWIKDGWVTILGTFALYLVGILIIIQGIDIVKDTRTTWGIGLVILSIAAYVSINSAHEMIGE